MTSIRLSQTVAGVLLSATMVLTLASCGGGTSPAETTSTPPASAPSAAASSEPTNPEPAVSVKPTLYADSLSNLMAQVDGQTYVITREGVVRVPKTGASPEVIYPLPAWAIDMSPPYMLFADGGKLWLLTQDRGHGDVPITCELAAVDIDQKQLSDQVYTLTGWVSRAVMVDGQFFFATMTKHEVPPQLALNKLDLATGDIQMINPNSADALIVGDHAVVYTPFKHKGDEKSSGIDPDAPCQITRYDLKQQKEVASGVVVSYPTVAELGDQLVSLRATGKNTLNYMIELHKPDGTVSASETFDHDSNYPLLLSNGEDVAFVRIDRYRQILTVRGKTNLEPKFDADLETDAMWVLLAMDDQYLYMMKHTDDVDDLSHVYRVDYRQPTPETVKPEPLVASPS